MISNGGILNGHSCEKSARRDGFTLVEVLIASLVLTLVLMGLFASLRSGFHLLEISRDQTRVSQILQSQIEDIRNLNWTSVAALPGEATVDLGKDFSFDDRYTCVRRISDRVSDQKQIAVKVSWVDHRGTDHARNYVTWYTKNGLNDYYYRSF